MWSARCFAVMVGLGTSLGPSGGLAEAPADLGRGGAYDAVEIAGFVLPVADVGRLLAAGVLRFDADRQRFSFGRSVSSERDLRREAATLGLEDPRALRDLYRANKVALPNGAAHVLTIPSGYGPTQFSNQKGGVILGIGAGGVSRVPWTKEPDGGIGLGLGFGNAFETVGVALGMSFNDLSTFNNDRISFGIEISRYIGEGLSVAVGGENLFARSTDGEESYFAVAGWAFDRGALGGALPFAGVVTLGLGSGRFAKKSDRDAFEGKGADATVVFGALAWEVTEHVNLIADWNGRNLSIGMAAHLPRTPISVRLGVRDLTDYTGDGPRITGSAGMTLARF